MATQKSMENLAIYRANLARDKILDLLISQIEESGKGDEEIGKMAHLTKNFIWRVRTRQRGPDLKLITVLQIYYALNSSNDPLFKILLESE